MSWKIKSCLKELTGDAGNPIIFNNSNKMSEFLIVETADAKALKTLADNILKEFSMEEYGPVSVAIHEQTSSLDDIGTVYRELISALVTRPFSRSHCVFCVRKIKVVRIRR